MAVDKKVTNLTLKIMKEDKQLISMLTAYDYSTAKIMEQAGIEVILVGDSLGMVVLGYSSTIPVTMEDMLHHVKAVVRGTTNSMVVADLPFLSYNISREQAIANAGRMLQEGGAYAVKLEGGCEIAPTVEAIVQLGIPVMGHIGLTPQSVNQFGGFKVQGKDQQRAQKLIDDALALEKAGAFSIVLEAIPAKLAEIITEILTIPTIGIGAGPDCDGQVLVTNDALGIYDDFCPKFVKQYAKIHQISLQAVQNYKEEVKTGVFPQTEHSFSVNQEIIDNLVLPENQHGSKKNNIIAGD